MKNTFLRRANGKLGKLVLCIFAGGICAASRGAIPSPENLLPSDTLLVVTVPDFAKAREVYRKSPQSLLLQDPAMKPFCDKFAGKFKEEFVGPLERDLGVKLEDYAGLAQGQFTVAVTQEGWDGQSGRAPAALLLLDTKEKSGQLKTNLANLRKKLVESGKKPRTETIRSVEFMALPLSSNDVPKTIRQFFPQRQEVQELGKEKKDAEAAPTELYVGQYQSLLIVGNSGKAVEKVVARLTGGSNPALADEALFEADRLALFRDAPYYGWFNAKKFFGVLMSLPPEETDPDAPSIMPKFQINKVLAATGLSGLRTVAFCSHFTDAGSLTEVFLGAPEAGRQGVFKIIAAQTKDSNPPRFVPADAVKFQRYRIDGQQAIATFEKMLGDLSPQALNLWNYFLTSASLAQKEKDQDFDLKKDLFGNLGDDFVSYTKAPKGTSMDDLRSPPALSLIGSPNAEKMAEAFKVLLGLLSPRAELKEREFLGRKIYTVALPSRFGPRGTNGAAQTLSCAASGGYLAIGTDPTLLEEYLRSNEGQLKPLRELPGLAEAAQKVGGQNTGLFSYENQAERMRVAFQTLKDAAKSDPDGRADLNLLTSSIPFAHPEKNFKDWLDFTLLPDFGKVSRYFYFSVYSGSTTANGISFKIFSPTPPGLR